MTAERRRSARTRFAGGLLPPAARIHPGRDVIIVDLSARGALLEGVWRLRPGARVELQLGDLKEAELIPGRVERCYVASLGPGEVRYRAAVRFDAAIAFTRNDDLLAGYSLPDLRPMRRGDSGHQLPRTR